MKDTSYEALMSISSQNIESLYNNGRYIFCVKMKGAALYG